MLRYYTRVCNFYYGSQSKLLVKEKKALPINGNKEISFDKIEIISRKSKKRLCIKKIDSLPSQIKKTVKNDLRLIQKKNPSINPREKREDTSRKPRVRERRQTKKNPRKRDVMPRDA